MYIFAFLVIECEMLLNIIEMLLNVNENFVCSKKIYEKFAQKKEVHNKIFKNETKLS